MSSVIIILMYFLYPTFIISENFIIYFDILVSEYI